MSQGLPNIEDQLSVALARAKQLAAVNTTSSSSSNGQKRSNSDDLNFQSAKRPNSGSNMAGMAVGAQMTMDAQIETIEIPDNAVGLVIGRGGDQISLIQQHSGCRVQMAGEGNASGMRQCTLQGPKHAIDKARQMISEVLDRSRGGSMGLVGGNQNGSGNFVTTELMIPGPKCGLIIGKSGETIKGLQESIGVKMLLVQDNQTVSIGPKPLRITGFPDKVEQAKRVVEQLLNSEDGGGAGGGGPNMSMLRSGPRSIGEVIVPRSSVGIIIGKGGETIKRLGNETGAKIQFKPDDDPNAQDRCAVIQGTPDQINRATQMISDLVTRSAQGGGANEVFYMHVPANKTGLVIGKGGDTIKQICGETGAHVELSREPPPNANEKVFVIKGSPYQIHHVQHIIRIKVGDIAPGTPVPPFMGAMGGQVPAMGGGHNPYGPTHQFGGGGDQFAAQWQQAQGMNVGGQDASAWAQYYNQQQQQQQQQANQFVAGGQPNFGGGAPAQHYQTVGVPGGAAQQQMGHHQAQPQQQQQMGHHQAVGQAAAPQQQAGGVATTTPAINPSTGQPDYSAQWAEYYRTMGMHEQAALIESQMKQQQGGAAPGGQAGGRPFYSS